MIEPAHEVVIAVFKDLCAHAYATAKEKGWYDPPKTFGEEMVMLHSEVSEAVELYRKSGDPALAYRSPEGKPEGVPAELADVLIRVFDLCAHHGIDIGKAVIEKMSFNERRPYRHGKKLL